MISFASAYRTGKRVTSLVLILHLLTFGNSKAQESPLPFPWSFVEIAILDADNPEAFVKEFKAITIDSKGRTSLVCTQSHIIHRFNSEGEWLGNIDRKGHGPGEFQSVDLLTAAYDGDLLIYDGRSGPRVTHLAANGTYVASFSYRIRDDEQQSNQRIAFATNDRYWLTSLILHGGFTGTRSRKLILVDRTGNELWDHEYENVTPYLMITLESRPGMALPFPNPAAKEVRWAVDKEGTAWIISPQSDQLLILDSSGKTLSESSIQLPPLSMTSREWRDFVHRNTGELRNSPAQINRDAARPLEKALEEIANDLAPIQRMWWAGPEGPLIDRLPFSEHSKEWGELPGRYIALLPDGRLTQESQGPGGLVAVAFGYAIGLRSGWNELAKLVLYHLKPVNQ